MFLFLVIGFQVNYLYLYFLIGQIADTREDVIRLAALLRGVESAWQAVSYGLNAVPIFAAIGGFYLNFSLWALAMYPAWLVIRHVGVDRDTAKWQDEDASSIEESGRKTESPALSGEVLEPKHA